MRSESEHDRGLPERLDSVREVRLALEPGRSGAVVVGPRGMGKAAVIQAALEGLEKNFCVITCRGSTVSAKTPYGALMWLVSSLSEEAIANPILFLREFSDLLQERAQGSRILLVLHNAHELDSFTALAVSQLVRRQAAAVLATAEDLSGAAGELLGLWSEGLLSRVDLRPLDYEQTRSLMARFLGGPVSARMARLMWAETGGNPHYIELLANEQRAAGTIELVDGAWTMTGSFVHRGDIAELLEQDLQGLDPEDRKLLEILSYIRGLPLAAALELGRDTSLEVLEEQHLVEIDMAPAPLVRIGSRALAGVLMESMPLGHSRRLYEEVSAALDPDALQPRALAGLAAWSLACGAELDEGLALRAAAIENEAGDGAAALRFIGSVPAGKRSLQLLVEQVRALMNLGSMEQARRVLAECSTHLDPSDRTGWATLVLLEVDLGLRLPGAEDLPALLDAVAAAAAPGDTRAAAEIQLARARLARAQGRYREIPGLLAAARGAVDLAPGIRLSANALTAEALAATGYVDDAVELLADGMERAAGLASVQHREELLGLAVNVHLAGGNLAAAKLTLAEHIDQTESGEYRGAAGDLILGVILAFGGEADAALQLLNTSISQLRHRDPEHVLPLAEAAAAYSRALTGDLAGAAEVAAAVSQSGVERSWLRARSIDLFRLLATCPGQPEQACEELVGEAAGALEQGNISYALMCLQMAAGLGSQAALKKLALTAAQAQGSWAAVLEDYALGRLSGDPHQLLRAAAGAADLHQYLLSHDAAVEAGVLAAELPGGRDLQRSAEILRNAAFRKLREAHGLERRLTELSAFEADLARRAATSAPRSDIAADLSLSPRTVDWHLAKIFAKLQVSGRAELRDILG